MLWNAQKDVENATTDFAVQVYSMLSQMNGLSLEALKPLRLLRLQQTKQQ